MLIEKTEKSSGVSEDAMTEGDTSLIIPASGDDRDGGNINSYPPAYSQAVGSTNYAVPPSSNNEKWRAEDGRHNQDHDYIVPPPGGPSTSSGAIPAASNYVHVFKRDGCIRGTWNIHPGLQIPPSLLPSPPTRADTNYAKSKPWNRVSDDNIPVNPTGPPPNLLLHTRDGRIYADVWISDLVEQDGSKQKQPTLLDLNTRDGKVTLRLRSHGTRPLDIRISTNDGPITVFLPRSYNGLILHDLRDGKLIFSPAMEGVTRTFSSIQGDFGSSKLGSSFIGDWRSLVSGDEAAIDQWEGDKCQVATKDGSIYFYWEEEYEEVMASRKSNWFKALYWKD